MLMRPLRLFEGVTNVTNRINCLELKWDGDDVKRMGRWMRAAQSEKA